MKSENTPISPPKWVDFEARGMRYSHVGGVTVDDLIREFDQAVEIIEQAVEESGWMVEGEPRGTIGALIAATCSYVIEIMREEAENVAHGE